MVAAVGRVVPVAGIHSTDEFSAGLSPEEDAAAPVGTVKRSVTVALTERVPVSVAVAACVWPATSTAQAHELSAPVVWTNGNLPASMRGSISRTCPVRVPDLSETGLDAVRSGHNTSGSRIVNA